MNTSMKMNQGKRSIGAALAVIVLLLCVCTAMAARVAPSRGGRGEAATTTVSVGTTTDAGDKYDVAKFTAPWFCHGIDCPVFRPLNDKNETSKLWEERFYPAAEWTETYVSGVDLDKAEGMGFQRLFQYISGANDKQQKVAMTAPVLNYITPGEGPFCEDHFNISFFVPFDLQGKVPKPTSPDVYSVQRPPMHVYVTSFGGYADADKLQSAAADLAGNLAMHDISFDQEHFYFAGYDSPFRVLDRHNEVWFLAK